MVAAPRWLAREPAVLREIHDAVPDSLVGPFEAVTHLGSPTTVAVLVVLVYLFGPWRGALSPEDAGRLLGVVVGGLALVTALKWWFALPRPPAALQFVAADGYGFPSGHATGSALGYGALAVYLRWGTARRRAVAAGVVVAAVAVSRVVIGVHYPVDVLVGAVAGAGFLAVAVRLAAGDATPAYGLAALTAVVAGAVAWPTVDGAAALGGGLGTAAGWWLAGRGRGQLRGRDPAWVALGTGLVALPVGAAWALEPPPIAVVSVFAVGAAVVVALPGIVGDGGVGGDDGDGDDEGIGEDEGVDGDDRGGEDGGFDRDASADG